ncbi:MAG: Site-specific DNA-methyltransferase (Adenine-specific) [Candidatus Moranbacteria bacterium GW2011_GWC2_37_73]|nr:MAG: Adenine-specific DNA-methyltransferase [Parcubacteria group bacterium GW2011_GWC1_36_108]KKQ00004.1 MAG: Site-specific DNA-methyltransferase (Adenine-specific) [Candidatus Moranbacteria bacterium GW2011_GWD2_36_198]KKQ00447.1 MAG: Site-specific DNA-methyltransferase (Adenine-specific) [Candidatus Moranbacteria bacterium GW2011_GWD1_36_198]KKQ39637.1 MAG: Site-specific DNA-methyltransferase (Adenine-specific) [Candidatus Moranbacteria bacterium GW2011_GWC2_37_73]HAR99932.1 modification m
MNYIGSKLSLLEFLEDSISKVVKNDDNHVFCDLFAGTGAVGAHFKKKGYKVIANDIQYYSYVLNRHYIGNHKEFRFKKLESVLPELRSVDVKNKKEFVCEYLSNLKGNKGFVYKNYCQGGTKNKKIQRLYFSDENGMKCDVIRQQLERWRNKKIINENEYFFLLTSLIESIDKCANTASVYGAFLKKLKKTAQKTMLLKPAPFFINDHEHQVYNEDINTLTKKIKGDIVYLDPPYNQRQYASNYHVLETIAKYDNPELKGKTGLREYSKQKSLYCSKNEVKKSFKDLILNIKAKYIFLSYNNEGLMTPQEVRDIMGLRGKYGCFKKEYNRFKADKDKNRDYSANKTVEYLHYVCCE